MGYVQACIRKTNRKRYRLNVRQGKTSRFWLFNDSGELIIANITPEGYQEWDRHKVIDPSNNAFNRPVVWSMPAFANRRVYVRNDNEIICLDLAK